MRKGWTETTLGEVASVIGGGTPSTTNPDYWEGDVVWLTPTEVVAIDGKTVGDSVRKLTQNGLKNSGAQLLPAGSVILTSRASVGFAAISECELTTNQGFQSLIPGDKAMAKFLMFWIQNNRSEFDSRAAGSTFKEISRTNVKSIKLILPPLQEQERIVDLISSVDSYIDALQRQADSARKSRSAVLHEQLSVGGDDWTETTLDQICEFENGDRGKNYPSANKRQSKGIPFVNAGHIVRQRIDFSQMDYISRETFEKLGGGKIRPDDIIFCLRGSVGKFGFLADLEEGAIASSLVIIRCSEKIRVGFLLAYLDSEFCRTELESVLTGAVQPNLSSGNLKNFSINLPVLRVQDEILEPLTAFESAILAIERVITEAEKFRSSLLSDLLSGEHEIPASYDPVMGAA